MTLAIGSRVDYVGTGLLDTYSYNFKIFEASDLEVTVRDTDDLETLLTHSVDYDVTGAGLAAGGTIVLAGGALADDFVLTIRRVVDLEQETDIRNQGGLFPEAIESQFDRLVMIDQQQQDEIDRSMKLPSTVDPSIVDVTLPAPDAGKFLRWNSLGTKLETVAATPNDGMFTADGVGAIPRSWQAVVGETRMSIKDYGGVPDENGTSGTDNMPAFNRMLSAAIARGGAHMYFPQGAGAYYFNGSPTIASGRGLRLIGFPRSFDYAGPTWQPGTFVFKNAGHALRITDGFAVDLDGIVVDGRNIANDGIVVDRLNSARWPYAKAVNCTSYGMLLSVASSLLPTSTGSFNDFGILETEVCPNGIFVTGVPDEGAWYHNFFHVIRIVHAGDDNVDPELAVAGLTWGQVDNIMVGMVIIYTYSGTAKGMWFRDVSLLGHPPSGVTILHLQDGTNGTKRDATVVNPGRILYRARDNGQPALDYTNTSWEVGESGFGGLGSRVPREVISGAIAAGGESVGKIFLDDTDLGIQLRNSANGNGAVLRMLNADRSLHFKINSSGGTTLADWKDAFLVTSNGPYIKTGFRLETTDKQTTVGAAGGASALPATPTGYALVKVNGTEVVIPYYAKV